MKIRKSLSLVLILSFMLVMLTPFGAIRAKAADAVTFSLPVNYYTTAKKRVSSTVTMTYSTNTISKGTVITLKNLPYDCLFSKGGYMLVGIVEVNAKGEDLAMDLYGGSGSEKAISNGTLSYTVQSNPAGIQLVMGIASGPDGNIIYDGYYLLDASGAVMDGVTNKIVSPIAVQPSADLSALANASVNNAEFNAKVYYESNPDLQTAIGPDAQALYNHWVQYGKAEGRKAK